MATVDGTGAGILASTPENYAATGHGAPAVTSRDDATVGTEYEPGHLVLRDGRIAAVGPGSAPVIDGARVVDGTGCLATPGLVATHQHLFQRLTRGMAQQGTLLDWLTALYPVWSRLDGGLERAAARAGLGALALSGCSTAADHHYLFPRRGSDDLLAAGVGAARDIGLRLHYCRGSLDLGATDLGASGGGLPPDSVVGDRDEILAATEQAIDRFHDPAPDSMLRIAVAPSAPLAVSRELMRESADLARRKGVRLHTHLAEAADEDRACQERFGCSLTDYLDSAGWLGGDVWLAHCVHLDSTAVRRLGRTGTGVAHCPSSNARLGAGIAPIPELIASGAPVGLGVDGAANEHGGLAAELRQSVLAARARRGPAALSARQALALGTMGGARCLGRAAEIGSLEAGKQADVALWRLDDLGHADIADPVCALVFGPPARLELLTVAGAVVVAGGELRTADADTLAAQACGAARELRRRSGLAW
ncbi:MAG TPA: 8-oxoguanine deaminase [Streptosporangiaceae bacterium]|nr:8-oxoguanine deaminase [Streptosporangiaceae bacterium]